eukprot:1120134-Pelagomonas_calceolata.AAC.3
MHALICLVTPTALCHRTHSTVQPASVQRRYDAAQRQGMGWGLSKHRTQHYVSVRARVLIPKQRPEEMLLVHP